MKPVGFIVIAGLASVVFAAPPAAPAWAAAKPKVSASGVISASNVLTVKGRVRPARASWRVRLQTRVSRVTSRGSRQTWVRRADSARLGRRGRFTVTVPVEGQSATVRAVVVAGRRKVIAKGRAFVVSRSHPQLAPAGGSPAGPASASGPASTTPTPQPGSQLAAGETLAPGERLLSPNRQHSLVMQADDGNLVLYKGATAAWATNPTGAGSRAVMQEDGNLVVYNGSTPKWKSDTAGFAGAALSLQDDGNLVIYHHGRAVWTWIAGYLGDRLTPGSQLAPGGFLLSRGGGYRLVMQSSDGNLVLYRGAAAVWDTDATGAGSRAVMQNDGNLAVYNGSDAQWASRTAGFPGAYLTVQDDGNAVVYHSGRAVWTYGRGYIGDTLNAGAELPAGGFMRSSDGRFQLIMQQSDGNLALYGPSGPLWSFATTGHPGASAIMQADGNFVIYSGAVALAHTQTGGQGGAFLRLQNDANLVVYNGATALWSRATGTIHPGGLDPAGPGRAAAQWAAAQVGQRYAAPSDAQLFSGADWAGRVGAPYGEWSGDCAKFVFVAWLRATGTRVFEGNAAQQYNHYKSRVQGGTPPVGALVFWPKVAPPFGHIAIADGSGGVFTTQGMDNAILPVSHLPASHFGTPAGWVIP